MNRPARALSFALTALAALAVVAAPGGARAQDAADAAPDPFLWLEDVQGERALAWVREHNEASQGELEVRPEFAQIETDTLAVLEAEDRIVVGTRRGDWIYDFWRDAENPRGLYRRASVTSYLAGKPVWDVLLDVDALAQKEGRSWVWKGMALLRPDYRLGLARLSPGGSDAVVVREFSVAQRAFVEDGFALPEAKGSLSWIDADTVYVATDFGPGSLTSSGYPRIVKRWRRGTPLGEAATIFEGAVDGVSVGAGREHYGDDGSLDWLRNGTSFYTSQRFVLEGTERTFVDIPATARVHTYFAGLLFIELKEPWDVGGRRYRAGTVLTIPLRELKAGKRDFAVFFEPTATTSLQSVERTGSFLLVRVLDDVRDRLWRYRRDGDGWGRDEITFPGHGTIWTSSVAADRDTFFAGHSSFLRPTTLYHIDGDTLAKTVVQQAPERFDPAPYESRQLFATSADGTRVPYFVVMRTDTERDGTNRTLLYAYGGFRISMRPRYLGALGKNWLERGGVYVVANIRGGGEYGPAWHAAALREKRHKAFEDFEAVAEDLIARKITSPSYLGIRGGSNGGLLMGAAFTRRPELYGAVVCQVPLLDMRRYNKLLAGASWMAEYGDPDEPADWAFLRTYSPYQNVVKDRIYPRVLLTTSTKDDRVHPGHARKMAALMESLGHPVLYYENTEGGHAGAADSKQRAHTTALVFAYLLHELGPAGK